MAKELWIQTQAKFDTKGFQGGCFNVLKIIVKLVDWRVAQ
ncbi:hypothetical protein DesLBE_4835 [Desulfitobacterium sp. LBE]|nr:hypothetical protein DesLBE_4835 [Desulfitobacterium sp. LBE]CDX02744.1 Hypothetical protein DPCES_2857 [Desulfitobacterium hafniense]